MRRRRFTIPDCPFPYDALVWATVTTKNTVTPPRMQASGAATAIDVAAGIVYVIVLQSIEHERLSLPWSLPCLVRPILGLDSHNRVAEAICLDSSTGDKLYVHWHLPAFWLIFFNAAP